MRTPTVAGSGGDPARVPAEPGGAADPHHVHADHVHADHVHADHVHAPDGHAHAHAPDGLAGPVPDEGPMGPSDPGSVVLDIGGSAGALVVSTPPTLAGEEIEIRAAGAPWRGTHTAVRERRLGDRVRYAGVFPRLDAGGYELRVVGAEAVDGLRIWVTAGVATETWMDAPTEARP